MQITNIILAAMAVLPLTEACKCVDGSGTSEPVITWQCCEKFEGAFYSPDCEAHSIKDFMKSFSHCCQDHKFNSDCKY
ncbi:hypothetical protein PT974_07251 [Cladobotryum mycophilum]|uniref:Extracellular membrane protein CFEM domain-containing protein n=1 Tax=Cladobotryum mycophilum TaxID=491253 RepID=A0ABR0SP47_9HYPO